MHPHPNRPDPVSFSKNEAPHSAVFRSRFFRYWLYFQVGWVTLAVLWLSTSHHLSASTGYSGETPAWVSGLLSAMLVGMAAQLVDGALGMAYGVTATTFLIANGASPAAASASVHIAEVFTTGASGWSHYSLGNVNKKLFWRLLVPGLIGVTAGAGVFTLFVGVTDWYLIAGLVLGGLGAAPLAAQETSRLSARSLLLLVGVLISLVSTFNLYKALLSA
jgi:uncharacterized membrane protein YfcA